jgi:glycosyltransferase involved in cell wall biosynthesis
MRIAHVITRMIVGGAQENTLLCCQDLMRLHGDDVVLITGPSLGPEGDLLAEGRGGAVPVVRIAALRRAIHPGRDWQAYRAILRALRDFRPEVVHTHSAKGGILGRRAASALRVPVIVHTVHGAPFHAYQSGLAREVFRQCERYAARQCHVLVSVADAMTDLLVQARVAPREKFVTVYSGMDVAPFLQASQHREATRARFAFAPDEIVIGKIARLFHLKGHDYLIEAARTAVERCPRVRFLLVGDGILREQLQQQIDAAGLTRYFRFAGLVPPEEIPALIGAMDVLVHASLREGLARALPQALIAGKPVVSYDIDGAREVVRTGETGFLLPPQSIEPLAQALVTLAEDPELRERMGNRGRELCREQFRHENMTAQLRAIYLKVLSGKTV